MHANIVDYDPLRLYGMGPRESGDPFFMGVELEVELRTTRLPLPKGKEAFYEDEYEYNFYNEDEASTNERIAVKQGLADIFEGFACIKIDGTIRDGFEIVSRPSGFAHQVEQWTSRLEVLRKEFPRHYKVAVNRSGTHCGTHVHLSKANRRGPGLSEEAVINLCKFAYNPKNKVKMSMLARRNLLRGEGATWARINVGDYWDDDGKTTRKFTMESINAKTLGLIGRCAVFPTSEHGTVELRMFRSQARARDLQRVLETAHSLGVFAEEVGSHLYGDYRRWLLKRRQDYPVLARALGSSR